MSYPFGSGMPPLPNQSGAGYPPHPNQSGAGYPPLPNQSGYPQQTPYPPFGGGFPQPNFSAPYANSNYPQAPYPNSNPNPAYPTQQYSTPQFGGGGGYPPQSGGGYPPQSGGGYPPQPSYQQINPNSSFAPSQGYGHSIQQTAPGYSSSSNCFSEAQSRGRSKGNPTVVPAPNFDPVADSNALRKAMKGFGTDEDALINIICRRSNEQRQIIQRTYKTNFGKDLIEDIQSETSGNFENLLIALLTPIVDFYVRELHDAMAGLGTDEDVLVEVLCSMSNYEIHTIKNAYIRMYGKNLESELQSETSGHFKRLLTALCAAGRDESGTVDPAAAHRDATELLRAGELRIGTDESTFNMVLCQRNYAQIKQICDEYQRMTGHTLEQAIRNEFSGDIMDGLIAILQCTTNKAEFFASRLHKSMAGIGTNDQQLIRLIVTRCEIDLNDIKAAFERLYGKSLRSWIKGDTSGHYKHALYALIGEQRSG